MGLKMLRIYLAAIIIAAIFLSYFMGSYVSNVKCGEHIATATAKQTFVNNSFLENANETVFHTGVDNIRRILYEKYTIAE